MDGMIMDHQLTIPMILKRARTIFSDKEVVSQLPGRKHTYTYRELYGRVVRLMNVLRSLGVKPGDRVATFAWNHYRHLELYYAIPCLGAVLHTLNLRLFSEQLAYIVNHARDSLLFVDDSLLEPIEAIAPQLKSVRRYVLMGDTVQLPDTGLSPVDHYETLMAQADDREEFPEIKERDAAGLCYTSGTTGNPKGVLYSHRGNFLNAMMAGMTDAFALSERDVVLPVVPMFHANAWSVPYNCAMLGSKLVFAGANVQPEALVNLIEREQVTFAMGVPTIWNGLLQYLRETGLRIDSVRAMLVGGSAVPRSMIVAYKQEYGVQIMHAWGMTEMSPLGAVTRLSRKMEDWPEEKQLDVLCKVGVPFPCVEMRIVDDGGRDLPWDGQSAGELLVRGPAIASGYYENPEASTQAITQDGWFRTGDVATIDENSVLHITDRTKDLIKSGGEWISSVEMENSIMACPGVLEAAVVARPDEKWGERPVAFVVGDGKGAGPNLEAILAHLSERFAKWQLPVLEDIRLIEQIPKTSVGKFDKKVLREQLKD
ncbi:MAG: long-chain fatty acid--CoA ligase [SAR324 cluster bacterium]|nr:long-chain fatty acid--CoA ligase [SAR324 cluster bacterium]